MAIAFARSNIISRSRGQSAVAAASYRSGEALRDERYGKTHDYSRKSRIIETGITLPAGAPAWAQDRAALWNAVEAKENRKDSQLSRELIVAIPCELSKESQVKLVKEIAVHLAKQGMAVDWALHGAPRGGDERNVHAHVNCTTRELTPDGFGSKAKDSAARKWNSKEWLKETKDYISRSATRALLLEGVHQFITFMRPQDAPPPQEHLGPKRSRDLRSVRKQRALVAAEIAEISKELAELDREAAEESKAEKTSPRIAPPEAPVSALGKTQAMLRDGMLSAISAIDSGSPGAAKKAVAWLEETRKSLAEMYLPTSEKRVADMVKKAQEDLETVAKKEKDWDEHKTLAHRGEPWRYAPISGVRPRPEDAPRIDFGNRFARTLQQWADREEDEKKSLDMSHERSDAEARIKTYSKPEAVRRDAAELAEKLLISAGRDGPMSLVGSLTAKIRKSNELDRGRDSERKGAER